MTSIDIGPSMELIAPIIPAVAKRPRLKIDLEEVERLAAQGLRPIAIGPLLGIPMRTFYYHWEKKKDVREAYDRGNAEWQRKLTAAILEKATGDKKDTIALIFSLKQAHGAGWADTTKPTTAEEQSEAQRRFLSRQREEKKKLRLADAPGAAGIIDITPSMEEVKNGREDTPTTKHIPDGGRIGGASGSVEG